MLNCIKSFPSHNLVAIQRRKTNLTYYLPQAGRGENKCIDSFLKVAKWNLKSLVKNLNQVVVLISYDDNCYSKSASRENVRNIIKRYRDWNFIFFTFNLNENVWTAKKHLW